MRAKLSDFIRNNIDLILERWEQFAQDIPSARHMATGELKDHAQGILYAIADDLDQAQTPLEQEEKSKGLGPHTMQDTQAGFHGAARISAGFSMSEAVSEFRALRASVLQLWSVSNAAQAQPACIELTRFNEAIDQALAESVARFSRDQQQYTNLFDTLLSSSPDLSYIFDIQGRFLYANQTLTNLYEVSSNDIVGKNFFDLGSPAAVELQQQLQQVAETRTTYRGELSCTRASGHAEFYEYLFVPVLSEKGNVEAIAGSARNITERKASEEKVRKSATHDFLTGLPNRSLFLDQLEREVNRSSRSGLPLALLFIDLDGFKEINDRLGHTAGDQLLQQAAQRISSCVRSTDMVARLGGDEFTAILTEVNKLLHVEILAREIRDELARPFSILQSSVQISGSIGITLFPEDATTPEELLKSADQAMYVAKSTGRNRFSFFTREMRDAAWARLKVIDELRLALAKNQLSVYYQPIVDLSLGRIVKAEALLRWQHPQMGLVLPGDFIGIAEESGLINDIGEWVLGEAIARAREWSGLLGTPFQIGVNKSAIEFLSKSTMKQLIGNLPALRLARDNISMEITESVLLSDSPSIPVMLDSLQQAGVQLAIDDFGTGTSSMAYLKRFDVNYLKIDQSFIQDRRSGRDSQSIAEAIIAMAHKLGLKVIAEGVETEAQADWLKAAECDYAQGYLFSAPIPSAEFEQLLSVGRGQYYKPVVAH